MTDREKQLLAIERTAMLMIVAEQALSNALQTLKGALTTEEVKQILGPPAEEVTVPKKTFQA
jgi:hypothetical protein